MAKKNMRESDFIFIYIYGIWAWPSLCLQMSWHLVALSHQQPQRWAQSLRYLAGFLCLPEISRHHVEQIDGLVQDCSNSITKKLGPTLLTLIPPWISDHIPSKVWVEITYPFPNFNGTTVEVSEWISNFIPYFITDVITYPCCNLV